MVKPVTLFLILIAISFSIWGQEIAWPPSGEIMLLGPIYENSREVGNSFQKTLKKVMREISDNQNSFLPGLPSRISYQQWLLGFHRHVNEWNTIASVINKPIGFKLTRQSIINLSRLAIKTRSQRSERENETLYNQEQILLFQNYLKEIVPKRTEEEPSPTEADFLDYLEEFIQDLKYDRGLIELIVEEAKNFDVTNTNIRVVDVLEGTPISRRAGELAIRLVTPSGSAGGDEFILEGYRYLKNPPQRGKAEFFRRYIPIRGGNGEIELRKAILALLINPFFNQRVEGIDVDKRKIPILNPSGVPGILSFSYASLGEGDILKKPIRTNSVPVTSDFFRLCRRQGGCSSAGENLTKQFVQVGTIQGARKTCEILGKHLISRNMLYLFFNEKDFVEGKEKNPGEGETDSQVSEEKNIIFQNILGNQVSAKKSEIFKEYHIWIEENDRPVKGDVSFGRLNLLPEDQTGVVWCSNETYKFKTEFKEESGIVRVGFNDIDWYSFADRVKGEFLTIQNSPVLTQGLVDTRIPFLYRGWILDDSNNERFSPGFRKYILTSEAFQRLNSEVSNIEVLDALRNVINVETFSEDQFFQQLSLFLAEDQIQQWRPEIAKYIEPDIETSFSITKEGIERLQNELVLVTNTSLTKAGVLDNVNILGTKTYKTIDEFYEEWDKEYPSDSPPPELRPLLLKNAKINEIELAEFPYEGFEGSLTTLTFNLHTEFEVHPYPDVPFLKMKYTQGERFESWRWGAGVMYPLFLLKAPEENVQITYPLVSLSGEGGYEWPTYYIPSLRFGVYGGLDLPTFVKKEAGESVCNLKSIRQLSIGKCRSNLLDVDTAVLLAYLSIRLHFNDDFFMSSLNDLNSWGSTDLWDFFLGFSYFYPVPANFSLGGINFNGEFKDQRTVKKVSFGNQARLIFGGTILW